MRKTLPMDENWKRLGIGRFRLSEVPCHRGCRTHLNRRAGATLIALENKVMPFVVYFLAPFLPLQCIESHLENVSKP